MQKYAVLLHEKKKGFAQMNEMVVKAIKLPKCQMLHKCKTYDSSMVEKKEDIV